MLPSAITSLYQERERDVSMALLFAMTRTGAG